MQQIEQKHFLALLSKPGDFIFIALDKLNSHLNFNSGSLQDIDRFTMQHTTDEIMYLIKVSNLAPDNYLKGRLVIQDNQKHNPIEVIDKNFINDFNIGLFFQSCLSNKSKKNILINKFNALINDEELKGRFKYAIDNNELIESLKIISEMPYLTFRKYFIYLIEYNNKLRNEKTKELIRDKVA